MALSENERAATFIGWIANCAEHQGERRCSKAPDMSRPENYMRALEGQIVSLENDYEGWHCSLAKLMPEDDRMVVINWHKTAGEAVIAAFAQLYDAEHPKGEADAK